MNLVKMKNDQEEFKDYLEKDFEPVRTEDGSFTLKQAGLEEGMHSSGGAVSESYYIYYEALSLFFKGCQQGEAVEVLSVGLGMGYNEILTAEAYLKSGVELEVNLYSYESEEALPPLFMKRLENPKGHKYFWKPFIQKLVNPLKIGDVLSKILVMKGSFNSESLKALEKSKRIILFDAYSKQTSEELWREEFLEELFKNCAKGSVVVTYAANGLINRSLQKCGFKNFKKNGFQKKRQSTLAVKV